MNGDGPRPPANADSHLDRIWREHRALAILRFLERSPGYVCNSYTLPCYLDALALGGTREVMRSTFERLEQTGAIRITETDAVALVTLTERGADLAAGRVSAEGIHKPRPECPY